MAERSAVAPAGGPRLVWDVSPPLLDYPEHGGRRVVWQPWEQPRTFVCGPGVGANTCEECGFAGWLLVAVGEVQPAAGDTFTSHEKRSRRTGRMYGVDHQVPAWPVLQLVAFRCPQCALVAVYDTGDGTGWVQVDITHPSLF